MNALDRLRAYLREVEQRLRWAEITRGVALTGAVALIATVLLAMAVDRYAFSHGSLTIARVLLFFAVALGLSFGLIWPLLRLNVRRAAKRAEERFPAFEQRLLTLAEQGEGEAANPFAELLAEDTYRVARHAEPRALAPSGWFLGFLSAGLVSVGALVWLILGGPGFLGHGASLLWAGNPKEGAQAFYDIKVTPGNRAVRRRADQMVTAQLVGFQTSHVRLWARYRGATKWDQAPMQPQPSNAGWQFVFAGLAESVDYYVEAGAVKSPEYTLSVVDLPAVKRMRVTYRYPRWMGLQPVVEDPGGDLRGVEGTEAEVAIQFDKPLANGLLVFDDERQTPLAEAGEANWLKANVRIQKEGMYHIAAMEQGQLIRLSEDFFIEVKNETPPIVKIARPRGDARVSPIEEVTVEVAAEDDFGLEEMSLRYSVNGGPEQTVNLLGRRGAKTSEGRKTLALEEFKLAPGDVVAMYAVARDARSSSQTDMSFVEAVPFEMEYSQSQQSGGGGGGGDQDQNRISARQKEIIAATWNQIRDTSKDRAAANENAKFLSDMQGKLREQARSLAKRMQSRELAGANTEFQRFRAEMDKAAEAMGPAADKLKSSAWKDALAPEQKALQHLLRAEATFRQIQVAYGARGGGGGGGMGRDLSSLFDLELDTEKNQYETGQQSMSQDQRAKEVDEALQKLEQLARRQKELADQNRDGKQSPQQRWQQEMLRREAEELQRQMERLARGESSQSQQSQSGQSSSQASSQGGQSGRQQQQQQMARNQQQRQMGQRPQMDPRLDRALDRLKQATEDMRRAGAPDSGAQDSNAQSQAGSRRAAERLQEARDMLSGLRKQEAGDQVESISRRAQQLAEQQRDFANRLRKEYERAGGGQPSLGQPGQPRPAEAYAREKEQMLGQFEQLQRDMQKAVRDLAGSNRAASSKLRDALGDSQQKELGLRMKYGAEWIRRGLGPQVWMREQPVTQGLEELRDQVRQAQASLDKGGQGNELEKQLAQVEKLRSELDRLSRQRGQQQGGQQQGGRQQAGQQQGGKQQGGQQQGGQQQGGQQSGEQSGSAYGDPFGSNRGDGRHAINRGDLRGPEGPIPNATAENLERVYREGLRDLSALRQSLGESPETMRDVQDLIREMQRLDPARFPGNPELLNRLRTQVLPSLEQLELQLRRKLEGEQAGQVRTTGPERVPQGYGEAVAEYFRRLSKGR